MNPGKHRSSKQKGKDGGLKVHDHAHLLSLTHTLCMNYVIAMCLLVICMNTRNLLLFFAKVLCTVNPQNSEQKPTIKNFAWLQNHLPLLTMLWYFLLQPSCQQGHLIFRAALL